MKRLTTLMLIASGTALLCLGSSNQDSWPSHDDGITSRALSFTEAPVRLVVDNFDGYVHVKAVDGNEVRLSAHKVIRAGTDRDLEQARKEVKLDIKTEPGSVMVYYDAPWRCEA